MKTKNLTERIKKYEGDCVFLLGNGINNYAEIGCSWKGLLKQLQETFVSNIPYDDNLSGITNTEYFDAMDIAMLKQENIDDGQTSIFFDGNLRTFRNFHLHNSNFQEISNQIQTRAQMPSEKFDLSSQRDVLRRFKIESEMLKASSYHTLLPLIAHGANISKVLNNELLKYICDTMASWKYTEKHRKVMSFAQENNIPVLTTNYDNLLAKSINAHYYDYSHGKVDPTSPITCCYTTQDTPDINGFAIWHPNGMIRFPQSILIGLTHYMRNLEKIRSMIIRTNAFNAELFESVYNQESSIENTWIKLLFSKNIFIFGLNLDTDEVVLRWLLLERAKLYALYPYMHKDGWIILPKRDYYKLTRGKRFFLKAIGFNIIRMDDYDSMYEAISI